MIDETVRRLARQLHGGDVEAFAPLLDRLEEIGDHQRRAFLMFDLADFAEEMAEPNTYAGQPYGPVKAAHIRRAALEQLRADLRRTFFAELCETPLAAELARLNRELDAGNVEADLERAKAEYNARAGDAADASPLIARAANTEGQP